MPEKAPEYSTWLEEQGIHSVGEVEGPKKGDEVALTTIQPLTRYRRGATTYIKLRGGKRTPAKIRAGNKIYHQEEVFDGKKYVEIRFPTTICRVKSIWHEPQRNEYIIIDTDGYWWLYCGPRSAAVFTGDVLKSIRDGFKSVFSWRPRKR